MSDREGVRERIARGAQDAYDTLKATTYDAMPRESKARWLRVADYVLSLGATDAPRTDEYRVRLDAATAALHHRDHGSAMMFDSIENEAACAIEWHDNNLALASSVSAPAAPGATPPATGFAARIRRIASALANGGGVGHEIGRLNEIADDIVRAGAPGAADALRSAIESALGLLDHHRFDDAEIVLKRAVERQHEADATRDRNDYDYPDHDRLGAPAPSLGEPVAPAPHLPPGYVVETSEEERSSTGGLSIFRTEGYEYGTARETRREAVRDAWAHYGRAAWQSARPDREVMDLLRECRREIYVAGCYGEVEGGPKCARCALLARLARALGNQS